MKIPLFDKQSRKKELDQLYGHDNSQYFGMQYFDDVMSHNELITNGLINFQARTFPSTALINKNREPIGNVNLQRSLEICRYIQWRSGHPNNGII